MATRTNPKRTQGITRRVTSPRRAALKGIKGGESIANKAIKEVQKSPTFQKYADQTLKITHKMGLKGGAAVLAGSAAGIAVGAALGGLAAAAMTSMRTARMAHDTRSAAESISRHAEDLKKFTGSKEKHHND